MNHTPTDGRAVVGSQPDPVADQIEAPHAREIFAELEKVTEKLHKKTPKITRPRTK